MTLTEQEDQILRRYAQRLNPEWGEDAYHEVICDILIKQKEENIQNVCGFIKTSIKYSLYRWYRHEDAERRNIEHYLNNDPIPQHVGLVMGRQKHEMCRKGLHRLIDGNLAYIGKQRTCRQCKRERERKKV